jgi:spermidine/putrescine transport system ATP-binding protein
MGQSIGIDRVTVRQGNLLALRDVTLEVGAGESLAILGPRGCGKTTLLRLVAGFVAPGRGAVRIGGRDMRGIGPERRPTALVFQSLALFPRMTVRENVAFGLEVRGVDAALRRRRAEELLGLVALEEAADRRVGGLSGDQRQRVALARALAIEPAALLLDEPLASLDPEPRRQMRALLRSIQQRTGITFVHATRDQGLALAMGDRVAVMAAGTVQQTAPPAAIYDDPATPFVASFVGATNAFEGLVAGVENGRALLRTPLGDLVGRARERLAPGARAILYVRPERLRLGAGSHANRLGGRISRVDFEGSLTNLCLEHPSGRRIMVQLANDGSLAAAPATGEVEVGFAPEHALVLPRAEA